MKKNFLTKNVLQIDERGITDDNGEKLDGHINDEEHLACKNLGKI